MFIDKTHNLIKHLDRLVKANFGSAEVHGEDGTHRIVSMQDTGIPAHEPGGGNNYTLQHGKTGKNFTVHQSKIKQIHYDKSMKKEEYCEDKDKLIEEHKRLVGKLKSKSGEERAEEAKVQTKELKEMMKWDNAGQWSLDKSNYGPKGYGQYTPAHNIERKANRTGEVVEDTGQNKAVHRYTTSGSSMQQAHEAAQVKDQKKKSKASLKVYSPEEVARLNAERGLKKQAVYEKMAMLAKSIQAQIRQRQPTDSEINFLMRFQEFNDEILQERYEIEATARREQELADSEG